LGFSHLSEAQLPHPRTEADHNTIAFLAICDDRASDLDGAADVVVLACGCTTTSAKQMVRKSA
jgi:hypothetical protein